MKLKRAAGIVGAGVIALVALVIGLASLRHPVAGWLPGAAHKSDFPPVIGAGMLVVPVVIVGLGVWRLVDAIALAAEARRQRRRRGR